MSLVTRNVFWRGLHMAQKKKVSANLELQSNLAQVNELGYPFSDMQRADFHAMNGFAKLVNKLLT